MGSIFKSLSIGQIVIFIVGTGGIFLIENIVPVGELRTTLLAFDTQLVGLLTVLFRKPSEDGGSVKTASEGKGDF